MDRNGLWYATAFCHTKMQSIKPAPKWSWMLSWLRASEELEDGIDTWDYFKHSRFIVNDSSVNQLCTRTISSVGDRNMSIYLGHPQWINRHMIHFEENKCQKIVDDHEPKGRHNTSVKRFQKLREYDGTCVSLLQGFCFFVYVSALLYRLFYFLNRSHSYLFWQELSSGPGGPFGWRLHSLMELNGTSFGICTVSFIRPYQTKHVLSPHSQRLKDGWFSHDD